MKKLFRRFAAAFFVLALFAAQALALTIGTFNIEYFNTSGKDRYVQTDLVDLRNSILRSRADVLALQEIEGNATMRFFTTRTMRGWQYAGNDTKGVQDLFFMWNPDKVTLIGSPQVYYANQTGVHEGRKFNLFDSRPPLLARFMDNATGKTYTLVAVHLKSMSTRGKQDAEAAQRYNTAKRGAQFEKLNELARSIKGPGFILGDYNDTNPQPYCEFPLLFLENGTSYDNHKSNLDYIGYINISRSSLGQVRETESRIARRSTKRADHPDHDIITVEILD